MSIKRARWIWYPGDFEMRLMNTVMVMRYERDVIQPPFWRMDDCWKTAVFSITYEFKKDCRLFVRADGEFVITLDVAGTFVKDFPGYIDIKAGKHRLMIQVHNKKTLPSLFVYSDDPDGLVSGPEWTVTCNDHKFVPAEFCESFGNKSPNAFKLNTEKKDFISQEKINGGVLYDFGTEMMAFPVFSAITGRGKIKLFYGESREEALDTKLCELTDVFVFRTAEKSRFKAPIAKAFRYIYIETEGVEYSGISVLSEYLPIKNKGSFSSGDAELNKIYETGIRTLHLNSREFLLDGIKRDRWVWGGDAYQCYLQSYYSFFDTDIIKRTTLALRGKEPVATHINHIMDYTFYWIMGMEDYLDHTGDAAFVGKYSDKIFSIMDFCIARANKRGLMEGLKHDWVFVDWADGLDNRGEVCVENMLYYKALDVAGRLAARFAPEKAERYSGLAKDVLNKIQEIFWDERSGGYYYSIKDGKPDGILTRHPGIFAIYLDIGTADQRKSVAESMLLSEKLPRITTPYMRFFELSALCKAGYGRYALDQIKDYWGGMIREGATTFWEYYDPTQKGLEKYSMYGRKFGRSLCHAWGATPVYLLGRYFIGARPDTENLGNFLIEPDVATLSAIGNFEARVPFVKGYADVSFSDGKFKVRAKGCSGTVVGCGKKTAATDGTAVSIKL